MRAHRDGRHEFGQNFLVDTATISRIVDLVSRTTGDIVEIGSGGGALTIPLQSLGRPITAVEIDVRLVGALRSRIDDITVTVVHDDFLRFRIPDTARTVVGNLPFHLTTSTLRRLLHTSSWTIAILLVQWEVARRRAGVGGASMMTAQWWPWFDFRLIARVPASAFTPRPGVDAGLMTMVRRTVPMVTPSSRVAYQSFVHAVFTGRGRSVGEILVRAAPHPRRGDMRKWVTQQKFHDRSLPRALTAVQWAEAFAIAHSHEVE